MTAAILSEPESWDAAGHRLCRAHARISGRPPVRAGPGTRQRSALRADLAGLAGSAVSGRAASAVLPDYAPEIDDETLRMLGTQDPQDLLLLLVVSPGETAKEATANLLAPIVFDQETLRATQLVLTGSGLPVREPLLSVAGFGR